MSKCACVVLNYNDYKTTINLVNSIKDYNNIELIIIVDNASTDDSVEHLKLIETQKTILVEAKENGGYGFGNNLGIRTANQHGCEYAIVANPDVFFTEELVDKLIEVHEKYSNCVISSAKQLDRNGALIKDVAWKNFTKYDCIFLETKLSKLHNYHYEWNYLNSKYCEVDCVPGAFLLVHVNRFFEIGSYDEQLFLYFEETVLGLNAKKHGFKTILLGNEYYKHNHSVSINKSIASKINRLRVLHTSKEYVLKNYLHANAIELLFMRFINALIIIKKRIK